MTHVPYGWENLSLGVILNGGLFTDGDWVESKDQDPTGGVRLTQLADVGVGFFRDRSDRWLREDQASSLGCTFLQPDDVLVARMPDPIGRACLVPTDIGRAVTAVDVAILRTATTAKIQPKYLMWAINSPGFHRAVVARQSGTTRKRISRKNLAALTVPVPPLTEQAKIVDLLEDHLSRIESGQSEARKAQLRIGRLRQSVWHRTFASEAQSTTIVPLLKVAEIANGQTPRGLADALATEPSDTSTPFYKVGDMNSSDGRSMATARFHVSSRTAQSLGLHIRPAGTVLLPKRGGAILTNKKRILRAPAAYDLNTMGLRPKPGLLADYLWHWLDGIDLGKLADGSNVPQINAPQIRELHLPVPNEGLQLQVIEELNALHDAEEMLRSAVNIAVRRGNQLRLSLLDAAFSGRLTATTVEAPSMKEMVDV